MRLIVEDMNSTQYRRMLLDLNGKVFTVQGLRAALGPISVKTSRVGTGFCHLLNGICLDLLFMQPLCFYFSGW